MVCSTISAEGYLKIRLDKPDPGAARTINFQTSTASRAAVVSPGLHTFISVIVYTQYHTALSCCPHTTLYHTAGHDPTLRCAPAFNTRVNAVVRLHAAAQYGTLGYMYTWYTRVH